MAGRETSAIERAIVDAETHPDKRLLAVAAAHKVDITTLRRALRRRGIPPRPPIAPRGARGRVVLPMPEPFHHGSD